MALKNHFRKPWTAPSDNTSTHGLEKPLPKASTSAFRQHKKHLGTWPWKTKWPWKTENHFRKPRTCTFRQHQKHLSTWLWKTTSESPEQRLPTIPRHMALKNHFRKPRTAPSDNIKNTSAHGLGKRNGLGKRKTTSESLEHAPSDNIKNTSAHGFE